MMKVWRDRVLLRFWWFAVSMPVIAYSWPRANGEPFQYQSLN